MYVAVVVTPIYSFYVYWVYVFEFAFDVQFMLT